MEFNSKVKIILDRITNPKWPDRNLPDPYNRQPAAPAPADTGSDDDVADVDDPSYAAAETEANDLVTNNMRLLLKGLGTEAYRRGAYNISIKLSWMKQSKGFTEKVIEYLKVIEGNTSWKPIDMARAKTATKILELIDPGGELGQAGSEPAGTVG